jgi:hypothetical protein
MIYVAPAVFEQMSREDRGSRVAGSPLFRSPTDRDEPLAGTLRSLVRDAEDRGAFDQMPLETGLLRLPRELPDRHGRRSAGDILVRRNSRMTRMACQYLEEDFALNPTPTDLAEHCRVSRFVLMRLFARHVGVSFACLHDACTPARCTPAAAGR